MKILKQTRWFLPLVIAYSVLLLTVPVILIVTLSHANIKGDESGLLYFATQGIIAVWNHLVDWKIATIPMIADNQRYYFALIYGIIGLIIFIVVGVSLWTKKQIRFKIAGNVIGWVCWALFTVLIIWQLYDVYYQYPMASFDHDIKIVIIPSVLLLLAVVLWFIGNVIYSCGCQLLGQELDSKHKKHPILADLDSNRSFNVVNNSQTDFIQPTDGDTGELQDLSAQADALRRKIELMNQQSFMHENGPTQSMGVDSGMMNSSSVQTRSETIPLDQLIHRRDIILPSSRNPGEVNTKEIESKIYNFDQSKTMKTNPNAKVYKQYENRVFLGDTDKIWDLTISNRSGYPTDHHSAITDELLRMKNPATEQISVNVNINFNKIGEEGNPRANSEIIEAEVSKEPPSILNKSEEFNNSHSERETTVFDDTHQDWTYKKEEDDF